MLFVLCLLCLGVCVSLVSVVFAVYCFVFDFACVFNYAGGLFAFVVWV